MYVGYCCDKVLVKYQIGYDSVYKIYPQIFGVYTKMPGTLNGRDYYQKKDEHGNYGIWWCKGKSFWEENKWVVCMSS